MSIIRVTALAITLGASMLGAQQDSTFRAKNRADSVAQAARDSIALMKELGAAVDAAA
ncbi:MAG: hypothetical protein H0W68_09235, partial [Gemmatimonadaceae bacterium]|nr:hypothetical protein [Gemmatimonadaceae bacterium]